MIQGSRAARGIAAMLGIPLAIAAATSTCLAAETPRFLSMPINLSSHSPAIFEDLLTGRMWVSERHDGPGVTDFGPDGEFHHCSPHPDRSGFRFSAPGWKWKIGTPNGKSNLQISLRTGARKDAKVIIDTPRTGRFRADHSFKRTKDRRIVHDGWIQDALPSVFENHCYNIRLPWGFRTDRSQTLLDRSILVGTVEPIRNRSRSQYAYIDATGLAAPGGSPTMAVAPTGNTIQRGAETGRDDAFIEVARSVTGDALLGGMWPGRQSAYRSGPLHAEPGAVSAADESSTLSERDKRQIEREKRRIEAREKRRIEKDARRRALHCAAWLDGRLGRFFRRARAVDVKPCLKMGASVTIRDRKGKTPLHVAAETTGDPDVITRLVEAGADVTAKTTDGLKDTPLHGAARYSSNVEVVARLIDLGADVNAKNEGRWQPLHMAAQANRNPDIPALLIERGAETTTTADHGRYGSVREVSLWDLARGNPSVHNSDWYRELAAQARQREKAEEAKRFTERMKQHRQRERLAEEARRRQLQRLAELEKQRKERERLAEEARSKQRKRLAERAARIARERKSCEPVLEEAGTIAAWRKQSRVITALNDDDASPSGAYAGAIPFLLAGDGEHSKVEETFSARVLRDVDHWSRAGVRRASNPLATWIGIATLLRENCLHEIADFIVVSVASQAVPDFGTIVFRETAATPESIHPDMMQALEHVPHSVLTDVSATGRMGKIPRMLEAAIKAAGEPFVRSCVDYFNAQFELQKGQSLTPVQRDAFTEECGCFHDGAGAKGYLADKPKFTDVMAELIDLKKMFSKQYLELTTILGRCTALHGQSLK